MAKPTRALWFIAGLVVGLLVIVMARGYQRFKSGGFVLASTKQRMQEGTALGRSLTADACIDTFFVQHVRTSRESRLDWINEGLFLESCLDVSRPTTLCDTVPRSTTLADMIRFASWSVEQCRLHGKLDLNCPHSLKAVSHYCDRRPVRPDSSSRRRGA